ncbi:uncharacterized protein TM35_000481300 [Trypanosoma theileri]|uniref:Uncharacterized protein n=1 Tax=Trypanosoma theileri TaxID=67003 RepID=A0A1X0NJ02_9TRYP|nr:uncharacterized protein TM35_000481300 [Trypanosoma theileri]ORC84169.1 hypothetical protein TM35_000481300 [Trypanosoma theileri]
MHQCSEKNSEMGKVGLEQLRLQLQHMRSCDEGIQVKTTTNSLFPLNNCEYEDEKGKVMQIPSTIGPFKEWSQKRDHCDADVHMLHQLEERLRRQQESGVKRRGELVYAVGKAQSDVEQLQYYSEQSQLDLSKLLQELQELLMDTTNLVESIVHRPEAVIKEVFAGYHNTGHNFVYTRERDARIVSRVNEMQGTLDFIQRKLQQICTRQMPSCDSTASEVLWAKMSSERERADAELLKLKEIFLSFVQETLDKLEQLQRERVEAEEQCTRILS